MSRINIGKDTRWVSTDVYYYIKKLEARVNQLETNIDEAKEEIKDLLEHWKGNDLVERDLNILLSLLERGKE